MLRALVISEPPPFKGLVAPRVSAIRELTVVCVQIHRDTDTLLCSHVADRSVVDTVPFPISPVFCVHPTHTQEPPKFPPSLHTPQEPCHAPWGTFFSLFPSCTWRSVHSGPFFLIDTSNETKTFKGGRTYFHLHSCKKTELKKSVNRGLVSWMQTSHLPPLRDCAERPDSKPLLSHASQLSVLREACIPGTPWRWSQCLCLFQAGLLFEMSLPPFLPPARLQNDSLSNNYWQNDFVKMKLTSVSSTGGHS